MDQIKESDVCPACGYNLGFSFSNSFEICPSCGIQFGYTDAAGGDENKRIEIYKKWRNDWIASGMVWDKGRSVPPKNWNPKEQLNNIPEEFK